MGFWKFSKNVVFPVIFLSIFIGQWESNDRANKNLDAATQGMSEEQGEKIRFDTAINPDRNKAIFDRGLWDAASFLVPLYIFFYAIYVSTRVAVTTTQVKD